MPRARKIDYRESRMRKTNTTRAKYTCIIRPAMLESIDHRTEIRLASLPHKARNAAHISVTIRQSP